MPDAAQYLFADAGSPFLDWPVGLMTPSRFNSLQIFSSPLPSDAIVKIRVTSAACSGSTTR